MSKPLRTLLFAAALCLVCSLLLTTASTALKGYQQRNMLVDRHRNILLAFGAIAGDRSYAAAEIENLYQTHIKGYWLDPEGQIVTANDRQATDLPVFFYEKDAGIDAFAVPINTNGLWGMIHGYLAIEADGATVRGFTVYKHSETPGLGGEIEKRWFQKNFEGKKIIDATGEMVSIAVVKGKVQEMLPQDQHVHAVDGISGATLTGKYLTSGLKDILQDYEAVAITFRNYRQGKTTLNGVIPAS